MISNTLTIDATGSVSATAVNSGTLGNASVTLALGSFGSITGSLGDSNIADALTISGGTIENTPIGATTPATGVFTKVTTTNAVAGTLSVTSSATIASSSIASLNVGNINVTGTISGISINQLSGTSSIAYLANTNIFTSANTFASSSIASLNAGSVNITSSLAIGGNSASNAPLTVNENGVGMLMKIASSSATVLSPNADSAVTATGLALLDVGNANSLTGVLRLNGASGGAMIVMNSASKIGSELTGNSLFITGDGSSSTTLTNTSFIFAANSQNTAGVYAIDSNGNTNISGTLHVYGTSTLATTTITNLTVTNCTGCGGGVSVTANNTWTGLNVFSATTTFTTTTIASTTIVYANIGGLNVTSSASFGGSLNLTNATISGLSTGDLSDASGIAFLANDQTFSGLNTFTGTTTFRTTTIASSSIAKINVGNLNITSTVSFTGATVSGLASTQLSDTSNLAYLNANQTFTGLNTFSLTTTFRTTTMTSSSIGVLNVTSTARIVSLFATTSQFVTAAIGTTPDLNNYGLLIDKDIQYPLNVIGRGSYSSAAATIQTQGSDRNTLDISADSGKLTGTLIGVSSQNGVFTGTGLYMNLGEASGGNFTGKFVDFVNSGGTDGSSGPSKFYIDATGSVYIANKLAVGTTTSNNLLEIANTSTGLSYFKVSPTGTVSITSSTITNLTVTNCTGCGGGVSVSANNTWTGLNVFNATTTFTTTTIASTTIVFGNVGRLNVTSTASFGGTLDVTNATISGLSTSDLSDVSGIAFLGNNQSFTGLNTFSATSTFRTTTISSSSIASANLGRITVTGTAYFGQPVTIAQSGSVDLNVGGITINGSNGYIQNTNGGIVLSQNYNSNVTVGYPVGGTWQPGNVNMSSIELAPANSLSIGSANNYNAVYVGSYFQAGGGGISGTVNGLEIQTGLGNGTDYVTGRYAALTIDPTVNVLTSSTRGYTGLYMDITETSVSATNTNYLMDLRVGNNSRFSVDSRGALTVSGTSTFRTSTISSTTITYANISTSTIANLYVTNCTGCGGGVSLSANNTWTGLNVFTITTTLATTTASRISIGSSSPQYGLSIQPTSGVTAGQTMLVQDATPGTGVTQVVIREGANQVGTRGFVYQAADGTPLFGINGAGGLGGLEVGDIWAMSTLYNGQLAIHGAVNNNAIPSLSVDNGYLGYNLTSGVAQTLLVSSNGGNAQFGPSSGNGVLNVLEISPAINQSGTATGTSRALYINPTVTSGADFRGLEIASYTNNLLGVTTSVYGSLVGQPTLKNSGGGSLSRGTTFFIDGAPAASSSLTIVSSTALTIQGRAVNGGGTVTNAYGLYVEAPTGAANNYAAAFIGTTTISNLIVSNCTGCGGGSILGSNNTFTGLNTFTVTTTFASATFSGLVGIGTTTPSAALSFANGNTPTSGIAFSSDEYIYRGDISGEPGAGMNNEIVISGGSGNTTGLLIKSTAGGSNAALTIQPNGGYASINAGGGGNLFIAAGFPGTSAISVLYPSQYVGISNSNPQFNLDVGGTFNVSQTSTLATTTVTSLTVTGTCTGCGGGVSLSADNTWTGLNIFNATTSFRTTTISSSSIGYLNVTSALNLANGVVLNAGGSPLLPGAIAQFVASSSNYLQVHVQNTSTAASASTDFVATADNGSDTSFYIDMGINGSNYNQAAYSIGGANSGYLYVSSGDLAIGTASSSKVIKFHAGGTTSADEKMRISETGITMFVTSTMVTTTITTSSITSLNVGSLNVTSSVNFGSNVVRIASSSITSLNVGSINVTSSINFAGNEVRIATSSITSLNVGSLNVTSSVNFGSAALTIASSTMTYLNVGGINATTTAYLNNVVITGICTGCASAGTAAGGVNTSTAGYFAYYANSTGVTGTPYIILNPSDITFSTNTIFTATTTHATTTITNLGLNTTTVRSGSNDVLSANGNIYIGAQPDATSATTTLILSASSTFATDTAFGVSQFAAYGGKIFVATKKTDGAAIYRYDGGTTWVRVTYSPGRVRGTQEGATVDGFGMAVYQNKLYIGTQTGPAGNAAMMYMSTNCVTSTATALWQPINSASGTFVATNGDGITDMIVHQGQLIFVVAEPNLADVLRYRGGTASTTGQHFERITAAQGKLVTGDTADMDDARLAVYGGRLYAGAITGAATARVEYWDGTVTWVLVNTTRGTFESNDSAQWSDVTAMNVYNGNLYIAVATSTFAGRTRIYRMNGGFSQPAAASPFTNINPLGYGRLSTADPAREAGAGTITSFNVFRNYNGTMYVGTAASSTTGTGAFYSYDPSAASSSAWTMMNNDSGGGFGLQSHVEQVTDMLEFNGTMYIGTTGSTTGGVYTWTKTANTSYGLRFDGGGPIGKIYFAGAEQANNNSGRQGTFEFTHAVALGAGAFDYAEDYPTDDPTLESGDLVQINPNITGYMRKALTAGNFIGVVSENPGFRLSLNQDEADGRFLPVALAGRVPVKVSLENGPILAGDFLTASTKYPGVAAKAIGPGQVVGQALESYYDDAEVGKVMIFVNVSYYDGHEVADVGLSIDSQSNADVSPSSTPESMYLANHTLQNLINKYNNSIRVSATSSGLNPELLAGALNRPSFIEELAKQGQIDASSSKYRAVLTDQVIAGMSVIAPQVMTGQLLVNSIAPLKDNLIVELSPNTQFLVQGLSGGASTTVASIDGNGNATFNKLTVKELVSPEFDGLKLAVEDLTSRLASTQSLVAGNSTDIEKLQLQFSAFASSTATSSILDGLAIATSTDATSTPALSFDNMSVLDGGIRIDGVGNLAVLSILRDAFFIGRPYFNSDTAGFAIVPASSTFVHVAFDKEYAATPVINVNVAFDLATSTTSSEEFGQNATNTPNGLNIATSTTSSEELYFASDVRYVIRSRDAKGFDIVLSKPVGFDLKFDWIALAVKDAKLFSPPPAEIMGEKQENQAPEPGPAPQPAPVPEPPAPQNATNTPPVAPEVVSTSSENVVPEPAPAPAPQPAPEPEPAPSPAPAPEPSP
jgi:hypothetical protein